MRTTIDLPAAVLARAKRLAAERETTLSAVVTEALSLHLQGKRRPAAEPFELVVCGQPGDPFPAAADIDAIEGEAEQLALRIPGP